MREYTLPNLSHILPLPVKVQYREKSEITKIKRRLQIMNSITGTATVSIQQSKVELVCSSNNFVAANRNIRRESIENSTVILINNNDSELNHLVYNFVIFEKYFIFMFYD